jgi:hypothetical protein
MLSLKAPLLAAAATLALTACGQATNTLPPPTNAPDISPTSLAAFAKATTKAGSSRLHLTMRTPTAHGTLYTSASGRFTTSGKPRGAMTLVLRGDGSKAVHMTERVVWPNLYIKSSIFRKLDPGAKPWIAINISKVAGGAIAAVGASSNNNATQAVSFLKGASNDVQNMGTGKIGGVKVTHYRAQIDIGKVLARMTPKRRDTARPALVAIERAIGGGELPMQFWVDGHGRLRAEQYAIHAPAGTTEMRIVFSDFGVPVHVATPPASQITGCSCG